MTRKKISGFNTLGEILSAVAGRALVPPRRQTVSEWAETTPRFINQPGAYVGPWLNDTVPYMVEPMDTLSSPKFRAEIFVGPAQCAKTDALILNWTGYSTTIDPQDMMIYMPTFTAARDFSMRRIDRLHRHTPAVGAALMRSADADNKFDKHYQTGMMLTLTYPSVTELAGRPVGRIALTDYDRMPEDIGGDGNPFDLATKRTTTFGSYAMTLAESSPSRELTPEGHKKVLKGHEAPPTTGILALYNRGDRRRWFWPCLYCGSYFEGCWDHMKWDNSLTSNMDKAETCYMECPECGEHLHPDDRNEMNRLGLWLKEGQSINEHNNIVGEGRRSNIASFWLNGVAAGLTNWPTLVKTYLDAEDDYRSSGDETSLKKFFNTDLGAPYIDKALENENIRTAEDLQAREEDWPLKAVPEGVRFLLGVVDVQANAFVVQIIGVAPGSGRYDLYLVDRFTIRYSERIDPSAPEGKESYLWVKPGAYLEDWDKITEQVMEATYPLADDSGRRMAVKLTLCDSGGKAGVTANAYNFYRKVKKSGWLGRFQLVKGDATAGAPRARVTYPDADKKSSAGARGEIPVLLLNPTINKDDLDNRLDIIVPGEGMIHFPSWITSEKMNWLYDELTSEIREPMKGWKKVARRNEAWDLFYYAIGACASSLLNIEKLNWSKPPAWADVWDNNPLVLGVGEDKPFAGNALGSFDWSKMGRKLG